MDLDPSQLPKHVAIILDGNGRWALQRGHLRHEGHSRGAEAVRSTVRECRRLGVRALTLYAFSEQNWQRSSLEVSALMLLLERFLLSERSEILEHGIRFRVIGRRERLSTRIQSAIAELEHASVANTGMTLCLALSYGGREELADAARALAAEVADGRRSAASIDEAALEHALPSAALGAVDLLIRTGGERRISNFVLWGLAYAELHFVDVLWPDFTPEALHAAIADYQGRDRRYGRETSAALDLRAPRRADAR